MGIDSISANERSNSIVKNLEADRRFLYNQKEVCLVSLSCCMDILIAHKRVLSITRSAHYTGNNLTCIWNNAVSIAIPYIHPSFLWKLLDSSWSSPREREGGDTLLYLCGATRMKLLDLYIWLLLAVLLTFYKADADTLAEFFKQYDKALPPGFEKGDRVVIKVLCTLNPSETSRKRIWSTKSMVIFVNTGMIRALQEGLIALWRYTEET